MSIIFRAFSSLRSNLKCFTMTPFKLKAVMSVYSATKLAIGSATTASLAAVIFYNSAKGGKPTTLGQTINQSRDLVQRIKDETGSPGISIAVSKDGTLLWSQGFGFADLENRVPCTPKTVMRIASISKSITMATVAKLWQEGKLDLDAPVNQYVKDFPEKIVDGKKVTITTRHLLSHLSGIRHYTLPPTSDQKKDAKKSEDSTEQVTQSDSTKGLDTKGAPDFKNATKRDLLTLSDTNSNNEPNKQPKQTVPTNNESEINKSNTEPNKQPVPNNKKPTKKVKPNKEKEMYSTTKYDNVTKALTMFKDDPLFHEPGTKYLYSTHGVTLASAVVEAVSGVPFPTLLTQLFTDFGMNHTYLDRNRPLIYHRARQYEVEKKRVVNAHPVDCSYKWAGGGMLSTVGDLVRFGNIMLYSYQYRPCVYHKDGRDKTGKIDNDEVKIVSDRQQKQRGSDMVKVENCAVKSGSHGDVSTVNNCCHGDANGVNKRCYGDDEGISSVKNCSHGDKNGYHGVKNDCHADQEGITGVQNGCHGIKNGYYRVGRCYSDQDSVADFDLENCKNSYEQSEPFKQHNESEVYTENIQILPLNLVTDNFVPHSNNLSITKECTCDLKPGYLKPDIVAKIWTPAKPDAKLADMYGLCWGIVPENSEFGMCRDDQKYVLHTGGAIGGSSVLVVFPSGDTPLIGNAENDNNNKSDNNVESRDRPKLKIFPSEKISDDNLNDKNNVTDKVTADVKDTTIDKKKVNVRSDNLQLSQFKCFKYYDAIFADNFVECENVYNIEFDAVDKNIHENISSVNSNARNHQSLQNVDLRYSANPSPNIPSQNRTISTNTAKQRDERNNGYNDIMINSEITPMHRAVDKMCNMPSSDAETSNLQYSDNCSKQIDPLKYQNSNLCMNCVPHSTVKSLPPKGVVVAMLANTDNVGLSKTAITIAKLFENTSVR